MNNIAYNPIGNDDKIIRVGDRFEKEIVSYDSEGRKFRDIIQLKKETILDLYGRTFLLKIPYYDKAVIVPSHTEYKQYIGTCINRYHPLDVTAQKGSFPTWKILMNRVFGTQVNLGWIYLALLYFKPTQILPILCLVSNENSSGKTTFGNALSYLFSCNVGFFCQADLDSQFNSWITKLIAVFEEINETSSTINKLKNFSTSKTATVNAKFQSLVSFNPFVKIVILSNNVNTFIKANKYDVRFWVRKLDPIPKEEFDPDFNDKLIAEVPAVMFYLSELDIPHSKSRMWFDFEEIKTSVLEDVISESRSRCAKDLEIFIQERVGEIGKFGATLTELSELLGRKYSLSEIRSALQDELGYQPPEKPSWGKSPSGYSRTGRAYLFDTGYKIKILPT